MKEIPALLGGNIYKSGDTLSKGEIEKLNSISAFHPSDKEIKYRIISFRFIARNNPKVVLLRGVGSSLSGQMKNALQKVCAGTKVFINDVKAKDANGKIINLPDVFFVADLHSDFPIVQPDTLKELIPNMRYNTMTLLIGGKHKGDDLIENSDFNKIEEVSLLDKKTKRNCGYRIVYYEILIVMNGHPLLFQNTYEAFPDEIKKKIIGVNTNVKLFFGNIKTEYFKDASVANLPVTVLQVKSEFGSVRADLLKTEGISARVKAFEKSDTKAITVVKNIYYPTNEYKVTALIAKTLDSIVTILKESKNLKLEIYSHTDSNGDDFFNLELSNQRAAAALEYINLKGVSKSRLSGKGFGEAKIINRCINEIPCTDSEHGINRRTEFKFVK